MVFNPTGTCGGQVTSHLCPHFCLLETKKNTVFCWSHERAILTLGDPEPKEASPILGSDETKGGSDAQLALANENDQERKGPGCCLEVLVVFSYIKENQTTPKFWVLVSFLSLVCFNFAKQVLTDFLLSPTSASPSPSISLVVFLYCFSVPSSLPFSSSFLS